MHSWLFWGITLRGGRGRTYQAHDQNNNIRERCLLLKNISKEKLGHFLSLHQLFHQNFYSTLAVAASGSPVEVRWLQVPALVRSESFGSTPKYPITNLVQPPDAPLGHSITSPKALQAVKPLSL